MQHYLLDIGLDICLRIFVTAFEQIRGLNGKQTVHEDSENNAQIDLILFEPNYRAYFTKIEVELSIFTVRKRTLHIGVFAEWQKVKCCIFKPLKHPLKHQLLSR